MDSSQHFRSFCQVIENYVDDINSHPLQNILNSLSWFSQANITKTINASSLLYLRIRIYRALDNLAQKLINLPTNELTLAISKTLRICQNQQPLGERIHCMMSDLSGWLVMFDGKLVNDNKPTSIFLYQSAWEELFITPPQSINEWTLTTLSEWTSDVRTSSDTFAHLIKGIREYLHRFLNAQRNIKDSENIITHPNIKTMKLKTETLFRIISANLENGAISDVMLRAISEVTLAVSSIYDPDPFSGLLDSARQVQIILSKLQTNSETNGAHLEPPKIAIEATKSPLITMLVKKRNMQAESKLFKQYLSTASVGPFVTNLIGTQKTPESEFSIAALVDKLETENEHGETLLEMNNIWIELDSTFRRIVALNQPNTIENGVMCSEYPGRFRITTEKLLWYGLRKDLIHHADEIMEQKAWQLAVVIPFSSITNLMIDYISAKGLGNKGDNPAILELERQQVLAIHTSTEVYRMFPFTVSQVAFIKDALEQIAKIKPTFQDHYVRKMLAEEIFRKRRHILAKLLKRPNVSWMESSSEIYNCISGLIFDKNEMNPTELEYLFHSCRLESAVTVETIVLLQDAWKNTTVDDIKSRILKIVDRLLDPLVMHKNDPSFVILYAWLRAEEPLINPYKSISLVLSISNLLHRCKNISFVQLHPIVLTHGKSLFQHWDEYNSWTAFYNQSGTQVE